MINITLLVLICTILIPPFLLVYTYNRNNFTDEIITNGQLLGEGITGLPEATHNFGCGGYKYLGPDDQYCDCVDLCDSHDYIYKFITSEQNFIVNNQKLVGGYCMKQAYSKCNLNTSYALVGKYGFNCVSKFPQILGGESGNQILVCNGKIRDKLLNQVYDTYIPNNLFMTSVDEKLGDGSFRFVCADEESTIPIPYSLGTRLEREENICNSLDKTGKFNETLFKCDCTKYLDDDENNICSGVREGFGVPTNIFGWKYGYNVARDCIDIDLDYNPNQELVKFPCGPKGLGVENALIQATNTYSPALLQTIMS